LSADLDAEDTLNPGTTLGRYRIVRLLGRGGMGAVYEGVHLDLKKRVAIKALNAGLAAQPRARARFLREGEAASRIQHRHVVDVTDVGTADGVTYLVMELLEGEDLGARLERAGVLSVSETLDVLLPLLAAIAVAHDEGVIHRDLKPENIFLSQTRHSGVEPKVLDFGISKISSRTGGNTLALTGTGASMGTPYYMAPEQIRSAGTVDARSDQYALGAILYQCLTGRRAHEGATIYEVIRSVGDGSFPPPRALRPDLPAGLEQVILRAMRLDPAQRFPSLRAMGQALLPFASTAACALWTPELSANGGPAPGPSAQPGGTVLLPTAVAERPPAPRAAAAASPDTTFGASAAQITVRPAGRGAAPLVAGAIVVVAGAGLGAYLFFFTGPARRPAPRSAPVAGRSVDVSPPPPREPARYHVSVRTRPASATLRLDGKEVGAGSYAGDLPADGVAHTLDVTAASYVPARLGFRDSPPPEEVTLRPLPVAIEKPPAPEAAETPSRSRPPRAHPRPVERPLPPEGPAPARTAPVRTENNAPIIDDD
jgi:tRNA A-37 threonylcarbamoyl transferase component Bud32